MLMHNAPRVTVMVMIFQVHAYNEWDIGEKKRQKNADERTFKFPS